MVLVKGDEMSPLCPPIESTHISYTLPSLYPCTEQMLAHCHCSKNGGTTNVLLDNDNVENIAQEMVRLLFVLFPISPSSPSLPTFPHHCELMGRGIVMEKRQQ